MKPGKPLRRKTRLVAKTPLQAKTPLKSGGFLKRGAFVAKTAIKAKRPKITPEERNARKVVKARSEGRCERCQTAPGQSMHHRRKAGRVWSPENLLHLCGDGTRGCHGWIEANPLKAQQQGWWVLSHKDPAKTPVHLAGRGYVFLNADGGVDEAPEEEVA